MQKPKPIAFKTKNEFQERPNYQANLSCEATELDYIVGKYHFGREHEFQCGLNHCNQWHQIGFVIATFGKKIQKISLEISNEQAFKRALDETIKLGGQIFGKVEQSEFMSDGANKTVVIATIDGGEAMSTSVSIMRTLMYQVQRPLNEVLSKDLKTLSDKEIKAELATLKNYTANLLQAEIFINQATRFTAESNLKKIGLLINQLSKHSRTDRVHRIAAKICSLS